MSHTQVEVITDKDYPLPEQSLQEWRNSKLLQSAVDVRKALAALDDHRKAQWATPGVYPMSWEDYNMKKAELVGDLTAQAMGLCINVEVFCE